MNYLVLTPAASAAKAINAIQAEVRTLTVTGPDIQTLLSAVSVDLEIAPAMEIDSDDLATELQQMLGRLSTVSAAIETERKERKAPLLETGKWLDDGYGPARTNVDDVIAAGKNKLIAWSARKAELARKEAEAAARVRHEEAARKAKEEAEALAAATDAIEEAAKLRAAGSEQVAQAMETQAMVAVDTARQNAAAASQALYVAPLTVSRGISGGSVVWKAECTDKAALLQHIGAQIAKGDKSLMNLVEIDPKRLNALAKMQEKNLSVPGLRPYPESRQAIRKIAVKA